MTCALPSVGGVYISRTSVVTLSNLIIRLGQRHAICSRLMADGSGRPFYFMTAQYLIAQFFTA